VSPLPLPIGRWRALAGVLPGGDGVGLAFLPAGAKPAIRADRFVTTDCTCGPLNKSPMKATNP